MTHCFQQRQVTMTLIKQYPVLRCISGQCEKDSDPVLAEYSLDLYINGAYSETLSCIPEYLEEMVMGKLYTSGMISSVEQIRELTVSRSSGRADATLSARESAKESPMIPLPDLAVCPEHILALSDRLLSSSHVFDQTGNVHSVMLCSGSSVLYFSEDVDRSHAFEKTVGRALKDHVDFSGTAIYTTGRIPAPIAKKTIRAGIPVIVSRSAPTDLTIELAREYNLTVIGFARKNRMNVYHSSITQSFIHGNTPLSS